MSPKNLLDACRCSNLLVIARSLIDHPLMGVLENVKTGQRTTLGERCLVGRREGCWLRIENSRISGEHAVIRWTGEYWEVRDLGSTNGTQADSTAVKPGTRVQLVRGVVLEFGASGERWRLANATPPEAVACHTATGRMRRAEEGLLVLPNAESPEVSVFLHETGRWLLESQQERRTVQDQELVSSGGDEWRLELPPMVVRLKTTQSYCADVLLLEHVTLAFEHSLDEESVRLSLRDIPTPVDLKVRASHYMLLQLARQRLADCQDSALPTTEHGWLYVDELCRDLRYDQYRLNLHIHRSRQYLAKAGIANAGQLIERRPGTQQLRIGSERLVIATPGS